MVVFRKEYRTQVRWRGVFCFKNMNYHKIIIQITLFILVLLFIPISLNATSGACSWHDGVDCSRGWQAEGTVYCNDGWTDSMVKYDFMVKCQENNNDIEDLVWRQKYYDGKIVESIKNYNSINSTFNEYCPPNSTKVYEHASYVNGILSVPFYCECNVGYYDYSSNSPIEHIQSHECKKGEPFIHLNVYLQRSKDEFNRILDGKKVDNQFCLKYGKSAIINGKCECLKGYRWVYDAYTKQILCIKRDDMISTQEEAQEIQIVDNEAITEVDVALTKRLKGSILLQVEQHGEAWYVNPKTGKRHYMANGNEAYNIMRNLGVGITNKDLEKIKTNKTFAKNNSGKIFLQVEAHGEAFYIDFNGVAHYLKDGTEAYRIMRELGLGITNNDIRKIEIGD